MFKNKKVLITGGSGMIGRQLVKLLQKESADVYVADLNEPMDAIVYGASIGLGFAAMENMGYVNIDPETAWTLKMVKTR